MKISKTGYYEFSVNDQSGKKLEVSEFAKFD